MRRANAMKEAQSAVAAIKGGEFLRTESHNRHAERLKNFQRPRQIQNRLRSRANHGHLRPTKFRQIRGHIHAVFPASMHAADSASRKRSDSRHRRNQHRACDGRRSSSFPSDHRGQIRATHLHPSFASAKRLNSFPVKTTMIRPSRIPIVAGTEPDSLTAASIARAVPMFWGGGNPWAINVDSRATTPLPAASAVRTSSLISNDAVTRNPSRLVMIDYATHVFS